ncbi:hypothetical protein [Aeromonas hydrophila]|uniref:hypothetical protein n=1 Tax=Aeromonas hydrophila TaxID=644 RepID=UPI002B484419|nr:hypothetical protein [Aeromonas hydrophila]
MTIKVPVPHSVKQMMPADGWFFLFEANDKPRLVRLAAWGMDERGLIHGMVSATTADFDTAHLVMVPSNKGRYLHKDELTDEHLRLLHQMRSGARFGVIDIF